MKFSILLLLIENIEINVFITIYPARRTFDNDIILLNSELKLFENNIFILIFFDSKDHKVGSKF